MEGLPAGSLQAITSLLASLRAAHGAAASHLLSKRRRRKNRGSRVPLGSAAEAVREASFEWATRRMSDKKFN